MKILIISPPNFKVTNYNTINSGSIEQFTYALSESLAKRGHKVTLFATKDAQKPKNVSVKYVFNSPPKNYYQLPSNVVLANQMIQAASALKDVDKYDYISNHTITGIPVIELVKSKNNSFSTSTTIHWRGSDPRLKPVLNQYPNHPLILISQHAKNQFIGKNVLGVIHHGIKLNQWPFQKNKKDYLLFVGKIIPEKGVDLVIKAARKLNTKLLIAGRIIKERNPLYFETQIKPFLSERIKYLGEVSGVKKVKLFKNAKAFIGPGRWTEPFGIVFIEAQACGTPVIAWNPGSSNDSVIDNVTGYIIKAKTESEAVPELINKIKLIDKINNQKCRQNIVDNYSIEKTAENYEKIILKQLINSK